MIRLTVSDAAELKRIVDKVDDISPILPEFGEVTVASIQRNFSLGGRYGTDNEFGGGSNTWVPSLRAEEQGGVTLNDRNILSNSITYEVTGKDELSVGTNSLYGPIHNFGGEIEPKNSPFLMFRLANGAFVKTKKVVIPERPFVVIQNEDLVEYGEITIAYYTALLS